MGYLQAPSDGLLVTDDEVDLLLIITNEYRVLNSAESVD